MDERTRSPDRADDGVRSIGDRQDAGGGRDKTVAEKTVTASVALLSVETSETIRAAAPLPAIKFCWRRRRPLPRRRKTYQQKRQGKYRGRYRGRLLLRVLTCGRTSSPRSGRGSPISAPIRSGSTASARPIAARPWRRSMHLSGKASSRRVQGSRPRTQTAFPRHPHDLQSQSEPGVDQRHVGRAGDQQADGQRELDTLAGGLEARSHGRKHPAILAVEVSGILFSGVYGSLKTQRLHENGPKRANLLPKQPVEWRHGSQA